MVLVGYGELAIDAVMQEREAESRRTGINLSRQELIYLTVRPLPNIRKAATRHLPKELLCKRDTMQVHSNMSLPGSAN